MTTIDTFIGTLPIEVHQQMHKDYTEYEKTGVTGATELRRQVEAYIEECLGGNGYFTQYANLLMAAVWRKYAADILAQ